MNSLRPVAQSASDSENLTASGATAARNGSRMSATLSAAVRMFVKNALDASRIRAERPHVLLGREDVAGEGRHVPEDAADLRAEVDELRDQELDRLEEVLDAGQQELLGGGTELLPRLQQLLGVAS